MPRLWHYTDGPTGGTFWRSEMADNIGFAVGRPPAPNKKGDQEVVQNLLNRIPRSAGGAEGALRELPQENRISTSLQAAIETFQRQNISAANRDGIVNP